MILGKYLSLKGTNNDRDAFSRGSKRSSRRSVKEKDATSKENIENKESVEKREKKILHRLQKIERIEKVIFNVSQSRKINFPFINKFFHYCKFIFEFNRVYVLMLSNILFEDYWQRNNW